MQILGSVLYTSVALPRGVGKAGARITTLGPTFKAKIIRVLGSWNVS